MIIIRVSPDNAGHCIDTLVTHCTHRVISTPRFSLVRAACAGGHEDILQLLAQCGARVTEAGVLAEAAASGSGLVSTGFADPKGLDLGLLLLLALSQEPGACV